MTRVLWSEGIVLFFLLFLMLITKLLWSQRVYYHLLKFGFEYTAYIAYAGRLHHCYVCMYVVIWTFLINDLQLYNVILKCAVNLFFFLLFLHKSSAIVPPGHDISVDSVLFLFSYACFPMLAR